MLVMHVSRGVDDMLTAYGLTASGPDVLASGADIVIPTAAVWIDVLQPSAAEDLAIEAFIGAALPTREETQEIEFSSRFYAEDGAVYMTVIVLSGVDSG